MPITTYDLYKVTYGNGLYVAVGDAGTILTSLDGTSWTYRTFADGPGLKSVIYGNHQYLTVGNSGTALSSPDGIAWTSHVIDSGASFHDVIYADSQYLAVGDFGAVFTSPDGAVWTARPSIAVSGLMAACYRNGQYIVVGDWGTILTSMTDNSKVVFQQGVRENNNGKINIHIANNNISITLPNALVNNKLSIRIFTVAGKRIYSAVTKAQNGILNIPYKRFPTGKYLISIAEDNNEAMRELFVITR
jgi:hypothetical protein